MCLNTTSLSPYHAIDSGRQPESVDDEHSCNSCICANGKAKCSNIWCGLKNCLATNVTNVCASHEVCVPALHESCLHPPCEPRGDCRVLERSRRVAPPKLPAPVECWPNQAILDERCARITILMENKAIQPSTSVEGICVNLRTLLGTRLVKTIQDASPPLLILLCDIKTGTNDTIEVTVVSSDSSDVRISDREFKSKRFCFRQSSNTDNAQYVSDAVTVLGELLSRGNSLGATYTLDQGEAAPLAAILEVKVWTTILFIRFYDISSYLLISG